MKRQAKRISIKFTPEQEAALRELRETIDREEKDEIIAMGREFRKKQQTAEAELNRVAEILQTERQAQDLSLADVQERSGIGRAALCRLEKLVDANPTIETLNRIAEALGKQLVIGLRDKAAT